MAAIVVIVVLVSLVVFIGVAVSMKSGAAAQVSKVVPDNASSVEDPGPPPTPAVAFAGPASTESVPHLEQLGESRPEPA